MKKREKFKLFIKRILNKSKLINKTKLTELISKGNLNFKLPELKDTFTRLKNYSFFKKQIITLSNARDDFKKNIEKKYFSTYQKKIKRLKISNVFNNTKKTKKVNKNQKIINSKKLLSFDLKKINKQFEPINKKFKQSIEKIISKVKFNNLVKKYLPKVENKKNISTNFFVIIHYSEHKLTISKILFDRQLINIVDLISINIPTAIIGDFKVENKSDLVSILEDIISLFDISNKPIMLLLGSSFFTLKSFDDSELVSFSEDNPQLLSKSPYLPDDTLVQYSRTTGDKLTSYHRVAYSNKKVMDTWIEVLSDLGEPIVGVTCSCIHLIEAITSKLKKFSILCDVDLSSTIVYLEKENCELNTFKLPFGASNYISTDKKISEQFFDRLNNSISLIIKKYGYTIPKDIFVIGEGIDKLEIDNLDIDQKFKKIPQEIFMDFKVNKKIDKSIVQENTSNLIKMASIAEIINK